MNHPSQTLQALLDDGATLEVISEDEWITSYRLLSRTRVPGKGRAYMEVSVTADFKSDTKAFEAVMLNYFYELELKRFYELEQKR